MEGEKGTRASGSETPTSRELHRFAARTQGADAESKIQARWSRQVGDAPSDAQCDSIAEQFHVENTAPSRRTNSRSSRNATLRATSRVLSRRGIAAANSDGNEGRACSRGAQRKPRSRGQDFSHPEASLSDDSDLARCLRRGARRHVRRRSNPPPKFVFCSGIRAVICVLHCCKYQ